MKMPSAEFDGGGPSRLQSARLVAAVAELKQLRSKRQPADHHSVSHLSSVISIGDDAFFGCTSLTGVYFLGNAPNVGWNPFWETSNTTMYYLPGSIGCGPTFGAGVNSEGRPTAPWLLPYPVILTAAPNFGLQNNAFGFRIS